jgi:hypothetical protein
MLDFGPNVSLGRRGSVRLCLNDASVFLHGEWHSRTVGIASAKKPCELDAIGQPEFAADFVRQMGHALDRFPRLHGDPGTTLRMNHQGEGFQQISQRPQVVAYGSRHGGRRFEAEIRVVGRQESGLQRLQRAPDGIRERRDSRLGFACVLRDGEPRS